MVLVNMDICKCGAIWSVIDLYGKEPVAIGHFVTYCSNFTRGAGENCLDKSDSRNQSETPR